MLLKQLALAASAAAFLVVPEVPATEFGHDEDVKALPISSKPSDTPAVYVVPQSETVSVPCAECKGPSPHLKLDFVVEEASRLTVNGYELYPMADPWHNDLVAAEVTEDGKTADQTLGYSLAVTPRMDDPFLELVTVDLRIIEVGSVFVEKVPTVRVNLLKMRLGGEVFLHNIELSEPAEKEDSLASRIKAKIHRLLGKFKAFGKCKHHKHMHHKGKDGHKHHHGDAKAWEGHRPGHGGKPHHHHGHHGFHRHDWGKLFKNIATNILLPVLTGLAAGVGVAVIAMGLCSVVAVIFARRKRCRRASRKNKAAPTELAVEDEKAGLMEDIEAAPPKYQDHPANEEA